MAATMVRSALLGIGSGGSGSSSGGGLTEAGQRRHGGRHAEGTAAAAPAPAYVEDSEEGGVEGLAQCYASMIGKPDPLSRQLSQTDDETTVCSSDSLCAGLAGLGPRSGSLQSATGARGSTSDLLSASVHSEASSTASEPPSSSGSSASTTSSSSSSSSSSASKAALPGSAGPRVGSPPGAMGSLELGRPVHRRSRSAQDIRSHYACKLGIPDPKAERHSLTTGHWRRASCLPEGVRPVIEKLKGRPDEYGGFLRLMRRQSQVGGVNGDVSAAGGSSSSSSGRQPLPSPSMAAAAAAAAVSGGGGGGVCAACGEWRERPPLPLDLARRVSFGDESPANSQPQAPVSGTAAIAVPGMSRDSSCGSQASDDARSEASSASSGSAMSLCLSCSPSIHAHQQQYQYPHPHGASASATSSSYGSSIGGAAAGVGITYFSPPQPHNLRNGRRVGGLKRGSSGGSRQRAASVASAASTDSLISSCSASPSSSATKKPPTAAQRQQQQQQAHHQHQQQGQHVVVVRRRIAFYEEVEVVHIPSHREYSRRVKGQYWASPEEIYEMACRNLVEYEAEGYAWESALEEDQLFWCPDTCEYVHPAHLEFTTGPPPPEQQQQQQSQQQRLR